MPKQKLTEIRFINILFLGVGFALLPTTRCLAANAWGDELSASFGEEFIYGRLIGESDDFRGRNLRGINAHLLVGLPIQLSWIEFTPGFYAEKRFTLHEPALSLMGSRDSVENGQFWGIGSNIHFHRVIAQGALILGGSSEYSTQSATSVPEAITHQLSLGSPFGVRAAVGYEMGSAIYLHATYQFSTFSTLEYPQSSDPLNPKPIEKKIAPSIQEHAFGIGLSAVY